MNMKFAVTMSVVMAAVLLAGCTSAPSTQNSAAKVTLEKITVTPEKLAPGQTISISSRYELTVADPNGVEVVESYAVKKNGQDLLSASPHYTVHGTGAYEIEASVPIPKGAEAGAYEVETKVQAGSHSDIKQVTFIVETADGTPGKKKERSSR